MGQYIPKKFTEDPRPVPQGQGILPIVQWTHNFAMMGIDKIHGVVYRLTYDPISHWLCMNNRRIYYARTYDTQVAFNTIFSQSGITKTAIDFIDSSGNKRLTNATSTKNNIQYKSGMPKDLRYLFEAIKPNGLSIITEVTMSDINGKDMDAKAIDDWLDAKEPN